MTDSRASAGASEPGFPGSATSATAAEREQPRGQPVAPATGSGKLLLLTRSLERGGAERQLVALARGLHRRGRHVVVAAFYERGALIADLSADGVPVRFVGKRGRWDIVGFWRGLLRVIREEDPAIIHGYLDVPNILATLAGWRFRNVRVVWGVRTSEPDLAHFDWMRRTTARLEGHFSRFADAVIANSRAGRDERIRGGWSAERIVTIPNGIDAATFHVDRRRGAALRAQWVVAEGAFLIGLVGRLHPAKDHETFLRAAAILIQRRPDLSFVCAGSQQSEHGRQMGRLAEDLGLGNCLTWAGEQRDMVAVYNALDVLCSSSVTEGLPNAVGEAMACEVPCVVTDAGDSGWLVGDPQRVVARRDPAALAAALETVVDQPVDARAEEGRRLRRRIEEHFSIEQLLTRTEQVLWPN